MAVITPQTDVYLLKVPLEMDEVNQLTFSNATAQYNYFNSLPKIAVDDFTYQRKDSTIRFGANFDSIITYNYCMYRNDAYSDKWFYAYITGMEYLNDNVTAITIKTDVWQTWQFDLIYKPVFVEREHVNDDTVGLHTVPENLELGPFINNGVADNFAQTELSSAYLCMGVSKLISPFDSNNPLTNWLTVYGGIYSGLTYMFFNSFVSLQRVIDYYAREGYANDIQTIFYVPYAFISSSDPKTQTYTLSSATNTATVTWIEPSDSPIYESKTFSKPSTLAGYTPKNNKLLCWPFCYFNVTNNAGGEYSYHYEDFSGTTANFTASITLSPSMSINVVPSNYLNGNEDTAWTYGMSGAKTPQCSWITDYYTNWLTQNAVNIGMQGVNTALSFGTSAVSGNMVGAASSLLSGIGGVVNQIYQAEHTPNQVNGTINNGDINFSSNKSCFTYLPKCIKREYAVIADNFLSMFGYAIHQVKFPNITGRRNWNYVKTQGCYIDANIPQADLEEIKGLFDRGITFWHNPATFADYSQNNDII